MSTITTINEKVAAAVTAIEAGEFSTALTKLRAAKALLSAVPNSRQGDLELEWDRRAIDSLIEDVESQLATTDTGVDPNGLGGGVQRTTVTYVRRPSSDCA